MSTLTVTGVARLLARFAACSITPRLFPARFSFPSPATLLTKSHSVGKMKLIAPPGHLTERWRKHTLGRDKIASSSSKAAAFESIKEMTRSGDVVMGGSRRNHSFSNEWLPPAHFA